MTEKKDHHKITYKLFKVETEHFNLIENVELADSQMTMYASINFLVDTSTYYIKVVSEFGIMSNGVAFLEIAGSVTFSLHADSWNALPIKGEKKHVPMDFTKHLADISLITTRGILHGRTTGHPYNKYLIPDLKVDDLVTTEVLIDLDLVK